MKISSRKRLYYRAITVLLLVFCVFGATSVNLARIQIIESEGYKEKAEENQLHDTELAAARGIIYDANGTVLAQSASVWKIYINPSRIPTDDVKNEICKLLAKTLSISEESVKAKADLSKYAYMIVKRQVELEEKEAVVKLLSEKIRYTETKTLEDGTVRISDKVIYVSAMVGIDPDVKRYYPYSTLASCLIGFTGADDIGRSGVELKYDTTLTGTPGRIITAQNGKSDVMSQEFETVYDAVQGTSLVLTVDEVIQRYLEDSLKTAYINAKCSGAYAAVMDVKTGAILAMTCLDSYDLNNPQKLSEETEEQIMLIENREERTKARNAELYSKWRNFMVSDTYEPGSVFKTITLSAALEENAVSTDMTFSCSGSIRVATETIRCHKRTGHGYQTLEQGLMNSCNPFFITIGQKLGKEKFCEYYEAFGFTEKTGIDLPAEAQPVAGVNYHPLSSMGIVELSSSSFGQSFQVTPVQMLTAISAIANGGKLMTPYVVEKQLDAQGNVIAETRPTVRRQVISQDTSKKVTQMMESVVSVGTGKNAYVAGYRVAGKTGTSQKLGNLGHYVASFAGFAPANDPEVAILILIDDPKGQINGGQICAPVASSVLEPTLEYLGVERQYSDKELEHLDKIMPNIVNQKVDEAEEYLEDLGFKVKVVGSGESVVDQIPAYEQSIPQGGIVVLYTEDGGQRLTATVPDLGGLTVSQASREALDAGLNIKISGNALKQVELVSYDQSIAAGETVEYGRTITVYFKSNQGVTDIA